MHTKLATMNESNHLFMYELENRRQCLFYFKFLICFCSIIHWSDSKIRALSILLYSSMITSDAQSKTKTKSFRKINFSLSEIFRKIYSFSLKIIRKIHNFSVDLTWNSLEHEIFASTIKSFSKNLWLHYDLIFTFDKLELIDLFAKIVAKRQIDDCFEISMILLWSNVAYDLLRCRNHVIIFERRFSHEQI